MMKKILLLFSLFYYAIAILAQVPAGYYASASGKSGKNLKTALHHIISQHEERTYKELWTDFKKPIAVWMAKCGICTPIQRIISFLPIRIPGSIKRRAIITTVNILFQKLVS